MKVPANQFADTVEAYRQLGIPLLEHSESHASFDFGPIRLHIDKAAGLRQSQVWLELITSDAGAAAALVAAQGFKRCDEVEPLPDGYSGFWVMNPAAIVHLVSEQE